MPTMAIRHARAPTARGRLQSAGRFIAGEYNDPGSPGATDELEAALGDEAPALAAGGRAITNAQHEAQAPRAPVDGGGPGAVRDVEISGARAGAVVGERRAGDDPEGAARRDQAQLGDEVRGAAPAERGHGPVARQLVVRIVLVAAGESEAAPVPDGAGE